MPWLAERPGHVQYEPTASILSRRPESPPRRVAMLRCLLTLVAVVALALGVACGGDDDDAPDDAGTSVATSEPSSQDDGDRSDLEQHEAELIDTATASFEALIDGDADAYYAYFTEDFQDRCPFEDFEGIVTLAGLFLGLMDTADDAEIRVENVRYEDGRAYIDRVTIGGEELVDDADDEEFATYWIREDGAWRADVEDETPCELDMTFGDGDEDEPAPTGPGTSRELAVPIGETVRAGDLEVTVLSVDLDATDEVLAANEFTDAPPAGRRFVLVRVQVGNSGDGTETVTASSSDFSLTGSENLLYDTFDEESSCGFIDGELDAEMFPGGTAEGDICFQVADDETGLILVAAPFFSFDDADRRFLALE
jgi:hypothetical protein